MTRHVDFREGRRLRAADLNEESASRAADAAGHIELAHSADAAGAHLVGATVTHPRGSPSLAVTPGGPAAGVRIALHDGVPDLEVGVPGGHHAAGSVTGDATDVLVTGALRLVSQSRPTAPSVPWSVRALDIRDEEDKVVGRELRIELSTPPGSPPHERRVAVGTVEGQQGFRPVLTVDAGGTVTLGGDLDVAGSVSQGEIQPDPEDPRFVELLAAVVARRVVGAATTSPDAVLGLSVTADDSPADETGLDISITPTVALIRWGAALETRRGGTRQFRLVGVGGPAAAATTLTIATAPVPWDPPLSTSSPARVIVAVAAFDAQGTLHAQRTETNDLTG